MNQNYQKGSMDGWHGDEHLKEFNYDKKNNEYDDDYYDEYDEEYV